MPQRRTGKPHRPGGNGQHTLPQPRGAAAPRRETRPVLHVCMTMDVERAAPPSEGGGPAARAAAERAVRAYCEGLAEEGMVATLFVVPDAATRQGSLLRVAAAQSGAELGMHLHPQLWGARRRRPQAHDHLGGYAPEAQLRLLAAALEQTANGLGVQPRAFRGGCLSASDATFGILVDLGFTHGSLSQPGLLSPEHRAAWVGACPDVHRAHAGFRLVPGRLDFVEVPLTGTRSAAAAGAPALRVGVEDDCVATVLQAARREVARQVREGALLHHVCLRSDVPPEAAPGLEGAAGFPPAALREVVAGVRELAAELGLEPRGATLSQVREAYLRAEAAG